MVYIIGYVVVIVSMFKVVVLFIYMIKSGELVFSVLVFSFLFGESFFFVVYFFFVFIIGGCVFVVVIEFNFNMIGNLKVMIFLMWMLIFYFDVLIFIEVVVELFFLCFNFF